MRVSGSWPIYKKMWNNLRYVSEVDPTMFLRNILRFNVEVEPRMFLWNILWCLCDLEPSMFMWKIFRVACEISSNYVSKYKCALHTRTLFYPIVKKCPSVHVTSNWQLIKKYMKKVLTAFWYRPIFSHRDCSMKTKTSVAFAAVCYFFDQHTIHPSNSKINKNVCVEGTAKRQLF